MSRTTGQDPAINEGPKPRNSSAIPLHSAGKNSTHAKHSTTLNRPKSTYRSLRSCGSISANIPLRQRLIILATWPYERTMLVPISWRPYGSPLSQLPHFQSNEDLTQHHILSVKMLSTPQVRTTSPNKQRRKPIPIPTRHRQRSGHTMANTQSMIGTEFSWTTNTSRECLLSMSIRWL